MSKQATARKGRNVIPFPGRAPSDDKAARALIRECILFVQSVAAYDAGFKADPDGDYAHAARLGDRHLDRASEAFEKISRTPATTTEGLQAKARIVPALIKHAAQSMDEREEAFFLSFAADVKAYLDPILHGPGPVENHD
jgi:hypothetical protein